MKTVAIIGAGPAGTTLAIQLKKLGIDPHLIDTKGCAGGLIENAHRITNYLGMNGISGKDFVRRMQDHLRNFDIKVHAGTVNEIKSDSKHGFFTKTESEITNSKIVVIAVGTSPEIYEKVNPELQHKIFYDLISLKQNNTFERTKRVNVIGSGESALDYSLSLTALGKEVQLLIRGNNIRATGILKEEVEKDHNIKIEYNVTEGMVADHIKNSDLTLSSIGRKSALDKINLDFDLPHPRAFVIGDAALGTLGQASIACGEALLCAAKIAKI